MTGLFGVSFVPNDEVKKKISSVPGAVCVCMKVNIYLTLHSFLFGAGGGNGSAYCKRAANGCSKRRLQIIAL
jgi:hypothetical protein